MEDETGLPIRRGRAGAISEGVGQLISPRAQESIHHEVKSSTSHYREPSPMEKYGARPKNTLCRQRAIDIDPSPIVVRPDSEEYSQKLQRPGGNSGKDFSPPTGAKTIDVHAGEADEAFKSTVSRFDIVVYKLTSSKSTRSEHGQARGYRAMERDGTRPKLTRQYAVEENVDINESKSSKNRQTFLPRITARVTDAILPDKSSIFYKGKERSRAIEQESLGSFQHSTDLEESTEISPTESEERRMAFEEMQGASAHASPSRHRRGILRFFQRIRQAFHLFTMSRNFPRAKEEEEEEDVTLSHVIPRWYEIVRTCFVGASMIGAGIAASRCVYEGLKKTGVYYDGLGDSMNTQWLAKKVWQEIGCLDMEVSMGTEADFKRHQLACPRQEHHHLYKPVKQFTMMDLPTDYQDETFFKYITLAAEVVAQVVVTKVSPNRAKKDPLFLHKGKEFMRAGSGFILGISDIFSNGSNGNCPCPECKESGIARDTWAIFEMSTARQFICDIYEAENSVIKLFYDDDTSKISRLHGMYLSPNQIAGDSVMISCCTHDESAILALTNFIPHLEERHKKMQSRYQCSEDLMIMISHPHGCEKKISVCTNVYRECSMSTKENPELTKYYYGLPTCRGCCGAPVFVFGFIGDKIIHITNHVESASDNRGISGRAVEINPFLTLKLPKGQSDQNDNAKNDQNNVKGDQESICNEILGATGGFEDTEAGESDSQTFAKVGDGSLDWSESEEYTESVGGSKQMPSTRNEKLHRGWDKQLLARWDEHLLHTTSDSLLYSGRNRWPDKDKVTLDAGRNERSDSGDYVTLDAGRKERSDSGDYVTLDVGRNERSDSGDYVTLDARRNERSDSGDYVTLDAGRHKRSDSRDYETMAFGRNEKSNRGDYVTLDGGMKERSDSGDYETMFFKSNEMSDRDPLKELSSNGNQDLDAQDLEDLDAQELEDLDAQDLEDLDAQDLEDLDAQDLEDLDAQDLEDLDAQDLEDLDAQDLEDLDAQGLEDLDAQDLQDLHNECHQDFDTRGLQNLDTEGHRDLENVCSQEMVSGTDTILDTGSHQELTS